MRPVSLDASLRESFRPWVVRRRPGVLGSFTYFARLSIDTPHRSLISGVRPLLRTLTGKVLDVGAGSQFYRRFLSPSTEYRALELEAVAEVYGWEADDTIDLYDGTHMPYADASFDHVLCLEVLEHTPDPEALLREITRVLKPGGTALLSVPFAAKWHYVPHDYWRFTPSGLRIVIERVPDLRITGLYRRGGEVAVTLHMATVLIVGLLFRRSAWHKVLGLMLLPFGILFGLFANASEILDLGAPENTLGYVCRLTKPVGAQVARLGS